MSDVVFCQAPCCMPLRVLNLYAGIGGNRKLWENVNVTAVEFNEKTASRYSELYPNDTLIIGDAHEYLLDHYKEFDFIWTSPPCQTHTRANYFINSIAKRSRYPDMSLYQEIIFLNQFCKGLFCVENVVGYYEPLIKPVEIGRHYLWTNFRITKIELPKNEIGSMDKGWNTACKIPLEKRNALNSELGLHVLNCAKGKFETKKQKQVSLFEGW
jgi:DNA (cytosine-5)-methyltransferase 1